MDEIGARVVGVAGRTHDQAQRLIDHGVPFSLLLDPEGGVRRAIGAERMRRSQLLNPRGAAAYVRSLGKAKFFRLTISEATQRPGVAVLDAQLNVTWSHVGNRLGDYPDIEDVITELRRAA